VARFAAPALLAFAAVATGALLLAGLGSAGDAASRSAAVRVAPVAPALRTVAQLGAPGELQADSGVGIYPALEAPQALPFPGTGAIETARRYARTRGDDLAFAVADERGGIVGHDLDRPFPSASLTKAMILVAYLRKLEAERAELSQSDGLSLGYMIRLSDNASAEEIYAKVGDAALRDVARRAGMQGFRVAGDWANATLTAADQARLFLAFDRLVPRRFRALARDLLETVSPLHAWGIPAGARPRWRVLFKGGWRPQDDGELVHQAALLERGSRRLAIAVLTRANPLQASGERSIQEVTERLLAGGEPPMLPLRKPGARELAPLEKLPGHR